MIVDSHCHLNYKELMPLSDTIRRAEDRDVLIMQTICTKMSEVEELKEIIETYKEKLRALSNI